MRTQVPLAALLFFLLAAPLIGEDRPDSHFAAPGFSAICHRSAFYHGYLHGYEAGFNEGDNDFQMGREAQDPARARRFKNSGWKKAYGDRSSFELGYRSGFHTGYSDSYNDRNFRAVAAVRPAVGDKQDELADRSFDKGVMEGYRSGVQHGLSNARSGAQLEMSDVPCALAKGEYCAGYSVGYRLGYGDGYINQQRPAVAAASRVK